MDLNNFLLLALTGILAGFVSGSLGVGGGIVIIPMLTFFLGLTQHQAQGTSLGVMTFPVFLISAFNYYKSGYVNVKFVLIIVITFIIGSYFSSRLAVQLPEKVLKRIFGLFLAFMGIRMLLFGK
jgi:uncharacterized membrane protein YfcA